MAVSFHFYNNNIRSKRFSKDLLLLEHVLTPLVQPRTIIWGPGLEQKGDYTLLRLEVVPDLAVWNNYFDPENKPEQRFEDRQTNKRVTLLSLRRLPFSRKLIKSHRRKSKVTSVFVSRSSNCFKNVNTCSKRKMKRNVHCFIESVLFLNYFLN